MPAAAAAPAAAAGAATAPAAAGATTAYCVKCRAKGEMKDPKESTTANGRRMLQGPCAACGTKMTTFIAAAKK